MSAIGRNQPCPCGNGKKYKRCHGAYTAIASPVREKQQGLGRPIVTAKLRHGQMVAVGNRVHLSPTWRTFHDFLRDHLFSLLGKEWLEAEQAKAPTERHRILQWFDQATEVVRRAG